MLMLFELSEKFFSFVMFTSFEDGCKLSILIFLVGGARGSILLHRRSNGSLQVLGTHRLSKVHWIVGLASSSTSTEILKGRGEVLRSSHSKSIVLLTAAILIDIHRFTVATNELVHDLRLGSSYAILINLVSSWLLLLLLLILHHVCYRIISILLL